MIELEQQRRHGRSTVGGQTSMWVVVVVVLLVVGGPCRVVDADLFTALVDLERVLHAEREVAADLRQYVDEQIEKLEELRGIADDLDRHSSDALADTERYLGNPVKAFLLIKRLTTEWDKVVNKHIRNNDSEEFLASVQPKLEPFPDEDDLSGAAEALLRLQDTYALETDKISHGELMGVKDSPKMTAEDCYRLGSVAYMNQDYYHTVLWMTEALNIHETEVNETIDKTTILDYLSYSLYMQGNVRHALNVTKQWLELDPGHTRASNNKYYYEQLITEEAHRRGVSRVNYEPDDEPVNRRPIDAYKTSTEYQLYERLCRGEETHDYEHKHELTCRYVRHHPLLYIQPVKEELLYFDPRISVYYDVMSKSQMEVVRRLARPRLERSVVYHTGPAGTFTPQNYRISKSAWLSDLEDKKVADVSRQASAIANLTLLSAEPMQVLNYGIGGHYEPHYDFSQRREMSKLEEEQGNRIATFLCYTTDVAAGGATVFPEIGVQLWPKLGSCALWYNLRRSGAGDMKTRHGACPVLSGFKWVCNKWFHERGQEFIRPCSASYQQ